MSSKGRKAKCVGKGSDFERAFCVRLSEWVTYGVADDTFWRSQASGARHTNRHRTGRTTAGQAGDIAAVDPTYSAITQSIVWELKRGYKGADLHKLFETPKLAGANELEQFFVKAATTAAQAAAPFWVLVTRRNFGDTLIWMNADLFRAWRFADEAALRPTHGSLIQCTIPTKGSNQTLFRIAGVTEHDFFESDPSGLIAAANSRLAVPVPRVLGVSPQ